MHTFNKKTFRTCFAFFLTFTPRPRQDHPRRPNRTQQSAMIKVSHPETPITSAAFPAGLPMANQVLLHHRLRDDYPLLHQPLTQTKHLLLHTDHLLLHHRRLQAIICAAPPSSSQSSPDAPPIASRTFPDHRSQAGHSMLHHPSQPSILRHLLQSEHVLPHHWL